VINGVYLFENKQQADKRCMDPAHNRGIELANTAIEMGRLLLRLKTEI
jgi:6,7-dimethyl-8-ribityllumazine synthase